MINEMMYGLGSKRSCIRELFEYGLRQAAVVGKDNVFDFSIGNPSIPSPPEVNEAFVSVIRDRDSLSVHGYTTAGGDDGARAAVAADLNRRFDAHIRPQNLFFTCGAAPALIAAIRALAVPEAEILAIAPYFAEYRPFVEANGAAFIAVPPDTDSFQIRLDALEALLTPRTQGVIVNSPNNPSGVIYTRETLGCLAEILTRKGREFGHPIYILADEPYRELAYDGAEPPFIPNLYPDTVVCYSYSKSLSLPGERIGYVCVPDQAADSGRLYAAIAGAGRCLGYVNAPSLFQQVTSLCCEETSDLAFYERNANILVPALREMGYHVPEPGGAFYLFPRSLEPDDLAFSERAKKDFDLLLVPGTGFGAPGHVRLAFCVDTGMIKRSLPKFKALAESYR